MEEGAFLDEAINDCFSRLRVPETIKGLVYQITSGVTRQKGYLDWVLTKLMDRETKGDIRHLLQVSLYQVAFMKKAHYHVVRKLWSLQSSKKE